MGWLHRKKKLAEQLYEVDVHIRCPVFTPHEQEKYDLATANAMGVLGGNNSLEKRYFETRGTVYISFMLNGRSLYAYQKEFVLRDIIRIRDRLLKECPDAIQSTTNSIVFKLSMVEALTSDNEFLRTVVKQKYDEINSSTNPS